METATLDDYLALNEQLAALVAAGVPLDVGLGPPDRSAAQALERINATVVRRVGRGESLAEALEGDDEDVPPSYRSLVQLGLHSGNLATALDGSSRVAASVDSSRYALESACIYPLIVCLLVYAGLIGLCLFFVPTLAGLYESVRLAPGPGLRVLQVLRDTLPYWATILPLILILFVAWRIRSGSRRQVTGVRTGGLVGWLPGVSKTVYQERCARFAASLAELLDDGVPLDESLRIAADGSGDAALRESAQRLATAVDAGQLPGDESPVALRFPPFLRWAIWHSEATTGRARALQIAARMYRETAERRAERLRTVAPVLALVLLGGSVTLLYGLALFVPMVELLSALAG